MTSPFANAMNKPLTGVTWNNALSLTSPDPLGKTGGRMSLFFKAVRGLCVPLMYKYIKEASDENIIDAFLIGFNTRDCRGGKGERDIGRKLFVWLFINYPVLFEKIISLIPEYGRWDDLLQFFPSVLNLQNLNHVRSNFYSVVPDETYLVSLNTLQKKIVHVFGLKIIEDYNLMMNGKPCSLAAKWAPTENDSLDRKYGVYKTLCDEMKISPRDLRKIYISPLREYIKIVERFMCTKRWDSIDYNKVPSSAMKRLKKSFLSNDMERFNNWKSALSRGDKTVKVNGSQLFPHELISEIRIKNYADEVCEAQWKVLEDKCLSIGKLEDGIVIVDTSSSMDSPNFLPIDVAIALGLLISNCTSGIFKNNVITFNTTPEFVEIKSGSIFNRWNQIKNIKWGGSTNIQATFKMILNKAKQHNLKPEDMPKRLWIISDMQFNQIDNSNSITNFESIDILYNASNYTRPHIIFWNVNGSTTDFPVTSGENGTALISGFSPSIMKAILESGDISPYKVMQQTLNDDRLLPVRIALGIVQ